MINSDEKAHRVQCGRVEKGKKGFAKAVRRYLRRVHESNYLRVRSGFPVLWTAKDAVNGK